MDASLHAPHLHEGEDTGPSTVQNITNPPARVPRISINRHSLSSSLRSPVSFHDHGDDSLPPEHPIRAMQGAFAESIAESHDLSKMHTRNTLDASVRRLQLIEMDEFSNEYSSRWQQRPDARFHPLRKIIAQVSFGVHLLHHSQAKSEHEVVSILQAHIQEVDGFIEDSTADFDLAVTDIRDRRRLLEMPLSHGRTFDRMLRDPAFRASIQKGNEVIERIAKRTAKAMRHSLRDITQGLEATNELHMYLERLGRSWPQDDEELLGIYGAMRGNAEGWYRAFKSIEKRGKELSDALANLDQVLREVVRRASDVAEKRLTHEHSSRRKESSGASSLVSNRSVMSAKDKPLPPAPSEGDARHSRMPSSPRQSTLPMQSSSPKHSVSARQIDSPKKSTSTIRSNSSKPSGSPKRSSSPKRSTVTSVQPAIAQVKIFQRVHSPASTVRSTGSAKTPGPVSPIPSQGPSSVSTITAGSAEQEERPRAALRDFEPPAGVQLSLLSKQTPDSPKSAPENPFRDEFEVPFDDRRTTRYSDKEMVISIAPRPAFLKSSPNLHITPRMADYRTRSHESLKSYRTALTSVPPNASNTDSDKEVVSLPAGLAAAFDSKPLGQNALRYEEKEVVPDDGMEVVFTAAPEKFHSAPSTVASLDSQDKGARRTSRQGSKDSKNSKASKESSVVSLSSSTSLDVPRDFNRSSRIGQFSVFPTSRLSASLTDGSTTALPSHSRSDSLETTALPPMPHPRPSTSVYPDAQDREPSPPSPRRGHGLRRPSLMSLKDIFGSKRQLQSRKVLSNGGLGGLAPL